MKLREYMITEKADLGAALRKLTGKASKDVIFDLRRKIMNTFTLEDLKDVETLLKTSKDKIARSDWKALTNTLSERKKELEKIQRIHKRREEVIKGLKKESINEGLSLIPIDLAKISGPNRDAQILRASIIAELDAANLYEQFADQTTDPDLKELLLDISREEKVHIGEFQYLLETIDPEHEAAEGEGELEAEELTT